MLGAARNWIYPASVDGKYQWRHRVISRTLIAFLLIAPWIRIGGSPLLLADIHTPHVYAFGNVFTPRDTILLLTVLLGTGLLLFLVTSLFGRLWCGYACPQTVLMEELVRRIERWVEGERGAQIRLAQAALSPKKLARRMLKWSLFALLATGISLSFSGFFIDVYSLVTGTARAGSYLFVGAIAGVLFLDFAWFREQFCHYLCPYARLQTVLTDENTINIGYDFRRGEPRKPRGMKLADVAGMGACVDCGRCVAVCPSGIDIRNGFQLECVACARCVDACEDVMSHLGQPSLVQYWSLAELEGKPTKRRSLRPVIYAVALVGVAAVFVTTVARRTPFEITIAQDPRSAETVLADGSVRNLYQLTIHNNMQSAAAFGVSVDLPGAELVIPGSGSGDGLPSIQVDAAGRRVVPAFVSLPSAANAPPISRFDFVVGDGDRQVHHTATFRNHSRLGSK